MSLPIACQTSPGHLESTARVLSAPSASSQSSPPTPPPRSSRGADEQGEECRHMGNSSEAGRACEITGFICWRGAPLCWYQKPHR